MSQSNLCALIVDDEQTIQYALSRELEKSGYECVTASNGQDALTLASGREFDLVMLDVRMPGMSGLEVLKNLRAYHKGTCVIMLTAMVETSIAAEAINLGADDYLTKPWDSHDLRTRVVRALERRSMAVQGESESAENKTDPLQITRDLVSQQMAAFERQSLRSVHGKKFPEGGPR